MKIAIISGASSGIGRCIAKELDPLCLDELWLIGRSLSKLQSLSQELCTATRIFELDLTQDDSFAFLMRALSEGQYSVEYLVASAGVGYTGTFESQSYSQISSMTKLNCDALTVLTSIALPYINKDGKILFLASGAGFLPQPDFAVYAASKAYVISFARALREELRERKIKVTAACPGPVDTEFNSVAGVKFNLSSLTAKKVANYAVKKMFKRKRTIIPGFTIKFSAFIQRFIPTFIMLKITHKMQKKKV